METRARRAASGGGMAAVKKDMPLRILLASIGLTLYASCLEADGISIEKLAECPDDLLSSVTAASATERAQLRRAAQEYVARHAAGADPQKQLELDMMNGEFFDDEEPLDDLGGLDLQAELDALKREGLFGRGSPDNKGSQPSEEDLSSTDSSSEEEVVSPPKPQPKTKAAAPAAAAKSPPKQQQSKQSRKRAAAKEAAEKQAAEESAAGGKSGKQAKDAKGKQADKPSPKSELTKRQSKNKKKKGGGEDKAKASPKQLGASSGNGAPKPSCSERLRAVIRHERVVPTLKAIRTVVSMLFTFYCANWGIAACARWIEYSTGRSMQLSNWFMRSMLMFAVPRPPLYPVPLYLCCNALVDVLEMWATQSGRFAEGMPMSVKVIGISLYACDIGAVLYGGCFLLTATTHCLALATGKPFEDYLVVDEFLLPAPSSMPPLVGYGMVMTGCVVLEQLQVWVEQLLTRKGGLRKFLRTHGVHIVLMFILLPIIGTFLAGISVFIGGIASDIVHSVQGLWATPGQGPDPVFPMTTLSRFFGPAFGRDTYITFQHEDIESSFREIDSNGNRVIAAGELKNWLATQQLQPIAAPPAGQIGRGSRIADAMTQTAVGMKTCKHLFGGGKLSSLTSGLDYQCYCAVVVSAVEEYYGEQYGAVRHEACMSGARSGGDGDGAGGGANGAGAKGNLGYTVSCKDEQEARIIHDFLRDHASIAHAPGDRKPKKTKRAEAILSYPQLSTIQEGGSGWVGILTSADLKTQLGDAGLDWRSVRLGSKGHESPWWAGKEQATWKEADELTIKYAKPYLKYTYVGGVDKYDDAATLRELAVFCAGASEPLEME